MFPPSLALSAPISLRVQWNFVAIRLDIRPPLSKKYENIFNKYECVCLIWTQIIPNKWTAQFASVGICLLVVCVRQGGDPSCSFLHHVFETMYGKDSKGEKTSSFTFIWHSILFFIYDEVSHKYGAVFYSSPSFCRYKCLLVFMALSVLTFSPYNASWCGYYAL